MDIHFDRNLAEKYHSASQIARVLTEAWLGSNIYCPRCGNDKIEHFPNNSAVADFFCPKCGNEYELKSKNGNVSRKIADGAYDTFIQRITSNDNPDFFIMSYNNSEQRVNDLWIVPKHFFTPDIVERRKPLSQKAKRAGWVGCNILFDQIPTQGRIEIVRKGIFSDKKSVLENMKRSACLNVWNIDSRGWLLDILNCVNGIEKQVFSLDEVYAYEDILSVKHPLNKNIRPKIRQQLQVLRDMGVIEFKQRGVYRKIF